MRVSLHGDAPFPINELQTLLCVPLPTIFQPWNTPRFRSPPPEFCDPRRWTLEFRLVFDETPWVFGYALQLHLPDPTVNLPAPNASVSAFLNVRANAVYGDAYIFCFCAFADGRRRVIVPCTAWAAIAAIGGAKRLAEGARGSAWGRTVVAENASFTRKHM